jgi:hypothetical protein
MRRLPSVLLVLLAPCLLAASCDFRTSTNTGIHPPPEENPPPQEGLVVVVRVGDDDGAAATSLGDEGGAALPPIGLLGSTSVLSSSAWSLSTRALHASVGLSASADAHPDLARPLAVVAPETPRAIANAVPEPGAALLFATGLGVVALSRRGR